MKNNVLLINEKDLVPTHKSDHEPFEYIKYPVADRADYPHCYVAIYEIPPHKSNYPYHYHIANTEAFYIIDGIGLLETPEGILNIKKGDIIMCPPHESGAHKLTNPSDDVMLRYIDFSTTNSPDVVHYPHSNKTGVIVLNESSTFFEDKSEVDYYQGE